MKTKYLKFCGPTIKFYWIYCMFMQLFPILLDLDFIVSKLGGLSPEIKYFTVNANSWVIP